MAEKATRKLPVYEPHWFAAARVFLNRVVIGANEKGWLGSVTRFINDILLSAPSIVIGLFIYAVVVARVVRGRGDLAAARMEEGPLEPVAESRLHFRQEGQGLQAFRRVTLTSKVPNFMPGCTYPWSPRMRPWD